MTHHDSIADSLNSWLETTASGKSPPDAGDPGRTDAAESIRTARQFHGLARRGERFAARSASYPSTWEALMATPHPALAATTGLALPVRNRPSKVPRRPAYPRLGGSSPWHLAANLALALVLLLALSAGVWRVVGVPGGGNKDPEGIPFGNLAYQDGTPEVAQNVDPGTLPKAEDCTITPLTIDEVLWYTTDTYEASEGSGDIASPGPLPTEVISATPPATNPPNYESGPASQEDLDAAAETQRMLTACVLADSYFQVWALLTPSTVAQMVETAFPPLTGEEEARGYLEDLEKNGPVSSEDPNYGLPSKGKFYTLLNGAQFAPAQMSGGSYWVLDTSPENSWQNSPNNLVAGFAIYASDGTLQTAASSIFDYFGTPIAADTEGFREHFGCSFEFVWHAGRQMWLVSSGPTCMG